MGIERKLNPGEYIEIPNTKAPNATGIVSKGCEKLSIMVSGKADLHGPRKENVKDQKDVSRRSSPGFNAKPRKAHRNYIWLPWSEGAVNYTDQGGTDVLSGPFTGCYMIRYKLPGGNWRIAHVATPSAIDAWNILAQTNGFEIKAGFKPFQEGDITTHGANVTYGVVTDEGECFRLVTAKRDWNYKEKANSIYSKILAVVPMTTISPDKLKDLDPM